MSFDICTCSTKVDLFHLTPSVSTWSLHPRSSLSKMSIFYLVYLETRRSRDAGLHFIIRILNYRLWSNFAFYMHCFPLLESILARFNTLAHFLLSVLLVIIPSSWKNIVSFGTIVFNEERYFVSTLSSLYSPVPKKRNKSLRPFPLFYFSISTKWFLCSFV